MPDELRAMTNVLLQVLEEAAPSDRLPLLAHLEQGAKQRGDLLTLRGIKEVRRLHIDSPPPKTLPTNRPTTKARSSP